MINAIQILIEKKTNIQQRMTTYVSSSGAYQVAKIEVNALTCAIDCLNEKVANSLNDEEVHYKAELFITKGKIIKLEKGIQLIMKDIQEEIETCPNQPNTAKKGCRDRLSDLLKEVNG